MYADFYNLKKMPFSLTPDSRFLFLSAAHKEALSHLLYGIRERKGFILVTGEIGTGKTTLCRALLSELGPDTEAAFIMNTFLSETELLGNIVSDLGAECSGRTKKELIDHLNEFLLVSKSSGKSVVVLIDECQNLSLEVMEQIRMLSNLETESDKLLQIVLVGQPEVRDTLAMRGMRQLDQRISVRYHLRPLSRKETAEYIGHRLEVAGLRGGLKFTRGALERIYRYSAGTPRLINIICDRALLIGYVRGARTIGRGIIRKAEAELSARMRRGPAEPFLSARVSPLRVLKASLAAAAVFAALLWWANRDGAGVTGRRPVPGAPAAASSAQSVASASVAPAAPAEGGEEAVPAPSPPAETVPLPLPPDEVEFTLVSSSAGPDTEEAVGPAGVEAVEAAVPAPSPSPVPALAAAGDAKEALSTPADVLGAERLLGLWGYDVTASEGESMEGLVERSGLKTVSTWAELPFILRVNLPCVLEAGDAYYVFEGIAGDSALCWARGKEITVPLADLNRIWDGRAFIVNRGVSSYDPVLHVSMRGNDVLETQMGLRELQYYRGTMTGHFDRETEEAVANLQSGFGLNADGIVGPETRLALWSMMAGEETPRLSPPSSPKRVEKGQ